MSQKTVELAPELKIGKLKDMMDKNLRFTAEFFVMNVLIPLEEKKEAFLDMLNLAPHEYLPLFIKCCGLMMSDVPPDNRLTILDRLLKAYKLNGFQLDLPSYNALMEVWLENEHEFNVDQMLQTVEVEHGLTVDVEFFNNLLWGSAVKGKDTKIRELLLEMTKRGIMPNIGTELPQIYSAALHGFVKNCNSLIERALQRYGDDKKIHCFSAQIRGVAASRNVELLKDLMRKNVIFRENPENDQKSGRLIINLPYETVFDVIWELARKSVDGRGQEFAELTKQI
uniref:Uncharacterized protein n=1 Tax=Panagrolaimus sp. JU765 TaxID=591449 RepID=A0AC34R4E8_9BILA